MIYIIKEQARDFQVEEILDKSILSDKDKKFKSLEVSLKQILDEANSQIENLNEIIKDYNKKNDDFLIKEKFMKNENLDLKQKLDHFMDKINYIEENYNDSEDRLRSTNKNSKNKEKVKKNNNNFEDALLEEVNNLFSNFNGFIIERRIKK